MDTESNALPGEVVDDTATVSLSSFPTPIFDLSGAHSFDGSSGDVVNLAHRASFEVPEATVAFSFTADDVSARQGLFTKDATGSSTGSDHLAIYIENGTLIARFQDGLNGSILTYDGLTVGQEYEIAVTLGANGVELYVDGMLVGSDSSLSMSLADNQEYLQIGGLGWGSQAGEGDFTNPFTGQINDIQIYGEILDAAQINELAADFGEENNAPVAADDAVTVAADSSVMFQPGSNDADADGDIVVASAISSSPSNGTAVVNPDGTVTYTPNAGFNGADSFDVTVTDGKGGFDTSSVAVTVDASADAPVLEDSAVLANSISEGTTFTVSTTAELGSALAVASGGDTILLASGNYGSIVYDGLNFSDYVTIKSADPDDPAVLTGLTKFSNSSYIRLEDLSLDRPTSADGTVALDIRDSDHIQIYNNQIQGGNHGAQFGDVSNLEVVGNEFDNVRSDNMKFWGVTDFLVSNNTGAPNVSPQSPDHVDFIQFQGTSSNGTISGNVLLSNYSGGKVYQGIFLKDGNYTNITIEDNLIYTNSANGIYVQDGSGITITNNTTLAIPGGTHPESGIRIVDPRGTITMSNNIANSGGQLDAQYTDPSGANYYGDLYVNALAGTGATIEDFLPVTGGPADFGTGWGAEARIFELLNATATGAPQAADDSAAVTEDSSVTLTAAELLSNDTDPDSDPLTVTAVSNGANGTVVLNGDGSVTYTPDADFFGQDSFTYTVSDGNGGTDTATVTVTIDGTADAPDAVDDAAFARPGIATVIDVLGNDADPDGDALQLTDVTQGANGTVVINADGTVTYTPNPGFQGTDTFSYTTSDGNGGASAFSSATSDGNSGTDTATVTVEVSNFPTPIFDLPGDNNFNGSAGDVINLAHDASLEIPEATIAFSFTANSVSSLQGLITKDASYYGGGGNHLAIYIENGTLLARFQDGESGIFLTHEGLTAGHEYAVAATFGANGVQLYVDGVRVGDDSEMSMSWMTNQEYLQIGGLGWGSQTGQGDFTNPFSGTISSVQIYGEVLDTAQVNELMSGPQPENAAPVAEDDTVEVLENGAVTFQPGSNDTDSDGDIVVASNIASAPSNGSAVVNADGTVTYTPEEGFSGADSFDVTVSDGKGGFDTSTVTVTVDPVADAPVAVDDTVSVSEGDAVTFQPGANDTDADGDTVFAASIASSPSNGSAQVNADGTVTYTPNAGFSGADSFDVTVSDGNGGFDTSTVTVTVDPVADAPVAVDDTVSVSEGDAVTFQPGANDTDADGDTVFAASIASSPSNGSAQVNADGTVTYTPNAGFSGTDSFDVTVSDGNGGYDTSTVAVTIDPVADNPVAVDDTVSVSEGGAVTFQPGANDLDPDGDTVLASSIASAPANGSAMVNADGTVTYTPAEDFNGTDSFEVTVSDGQGGFDTSTVTVTVDPVADAPVALDDAVRVDEDGSVTFQPGANDTDADGDTVLASVIASPPANGTAVVNANGTVTYTPSAGFNGTDSFDVVVTDGNGGFDRSTVTVAVDAVADAPDAVDDTINVDEDGSVTFQPCANDTDDDGDAVVASTIASSPSNGSARVNNDGTVTYTPDAGFNGGDSFDVTVSDGNGGFDTSTVVVSVAAVADAPVAVDDTASVESDSAVVIDVLANDTDADGDAVEVTATTQGANGTVAVNADGTLTYTPYVGFQGTDSFDYTVSDGNGGTDTATVSVTVSPFPTSVFDLAGVHEFDGTAGTVINVAHQASFELPEATVAFSFTADSVSGMQGLLTKDASYYTGGGNHLAIYIEDGTLTARFQDGQTGSFLTYSGLIAGHEYEVAATLGANGVELYVDGELVGADAGLIMSLAGNQEYLQIGGLGWGSRTGEGDFTNPFSGQINDIQIFGDVLDAAQISELAGDTGSVNEVPVAVDDAVTVDEDGSVTFQPGANDTDADGDTVVTSAIASSPSNGTAVLNDNGTVTYTPDADFNGADSFEVTVSDGKGGFDTSTIAVTVDPVADAPVAGDDIASAESDTPVVINVAGNDSDPDGDVVQVTSVSHGANGSVAINADGTVTYTPNSGFEGLDSFEYVVSDGNGGIDTATVTVNVLPFPTPVFDLAGEHGFNGSADAVINLAHDESFEVAEATLAFSFTADSVNTRQGLVTKDAYEYYGGGNHLAIYIENGTLIARFQDDLFGAVLTRDGIVAGQEYEVAVTFGANGVELYIDGGLVGSDAGLNMSWLGNQEYLQIGGLGWDSQSGQGDFTNPFSGQISDVQIYDQVLNAPQINKLVAEPGPQNGAPVAINDIAETQADTTVVIDVLGNDIDPDGDDLLVAGIDQSANGTTVVNADGTLSYTPNDGFHGTDGFTYTLSDGKGGTSTATVTIDVAEPANPNVGVVLNGGSGRDALAGGEGDDYINGWGGSDRLYGGAGGDTINGGSGSDRIWGGQGNDQLFGGDGSDKMYGQDGNDVLTGSAGRDDLDGGAGDDILIGGTGDDRYVGGSGNDTLVFNADISEFNFSTGSRGSVIIDHVRGNGSLGTDTVRSGIETIDFNGDLLDFDDLVSALDTHGTVTGDDLFV